MLDQRERFSSQLYHIALAKSMDPQFVGRPLRAICIALIGTAHAYGIKVTEELQPESDRSSRTANRIAAPLTQMIDLSKDSKRFVRVLQGDRRKNNFNNIK